jgi:hypothetical protein
MLVLFIIAACAPVTEPTPTFERAPSLAPSPTVLPIIPEDNPDTFIGRSNPTSAALAAEGHPSQDPSLAPQATEQSIPFTVIASDGTMLASRYFGAGSDSAVVLLHDNDGDLVSMNLLGAALQQAGFKVMALTLRGYRPSSGQVDWSQAQDDALSGIDSILTLPGVTRVALLGVGRSSTAAMLACAQHSECAAIILVNPIPDEASSPLEQASTTIGDRPLLMLVSQERAEAQQNAQIIQASAGASGAIQVFPALTVDQLVTITPLADWLFQSLGVAIPSGN